MIQLIGNLDTSKVEELKKTCTVAQMITFKSQARMLSLKRAEFIKSILVKKYGISEDRILTVGMGWENPMEGAKPEDNRRVEVKFLAFE
jgi:hypothetical protein